MTEQGSEPAEADMDTGPIRIPEDLGGPAGGYGGLPGSGGFAENPTPPSGYPSAWPHAVSPLLPPVPLVPPPPVAPAAAAPPPASPLPPLGSPRKERESVVALFLVHMFPIGHLPVATDKPAQQLPLPAGAASLGPFSHPDIRLLVDDQSLTNVTAGFRRSPNAPSRPIPPEMTEDYAPYGHASESAWERRFVADEGELGPEYVWPPSVPAEAIMLAEDTFLDRFGPPYGRVFYEDGTRFPERALPPGWLELGYRRYRVVRRVPMWRSEAAQWFGQPGGAVRYRAPRGADELVTLGYLAEVKGEDR